MNKPRFSLIPQFSFQCLVDVTPVFLEKHGIGFLMLDLDNTIATYDAPAPSEAVLEWAQMLREHGVTLFLVSNSKRETRVEEFAKTLGADFIFRAKKPSPAGLHNSMQKAGHSADTSALVGDQIITDILAANRAGVASIIVHPIRLTNVFYLLRYFLELPFRWIGKARS